MKLKFLFLLPFFFSSVLFAAGQNSHLQSDFILPKADWKEIKSPMHSGDQKLLTIKDDANNQIYLYWMGPAAETAVQEHPKHEEVIIVQGSLYWLNQDKSVLKKLAVGSYVDRKPHIKHGPFKAGPEGCLMYVRFHG